MRRFLIGLSIFLGAVLVLLILAAVAAEHFLGKIRVIDPATQGTLSQAEAESIRQDAYETIGGADPLPSVEATEPMAQPGAQGEHIVNILLIGQDRRAGQGTQRSDSMILVTFNKSTGVIALTSIMRDQLVHIPGYGSDKLNHAYQYGGMELLDRVLYEHFGIRVDGNVEVDFSGFQEIIDLLGGVEIELTQKEAEHLDKVWGWSLRSGKNVLSGEQALAYARLRAIDSDYSRAQRQQKVIISVLEAYKGESLPRMLKILENCLELVTTDVPRERIMAYGAELFGLVAGGKVVSGRIPADGTFSEGYIRVSATHKLWCQYNIDFAANREELQKIFVP